MPVYDDEKLKKKSKQHHDDMGVHPERREAEIDSLNKQFNAPSAKEPQDIKKAEEAANDGSSVSNEQQSEVDHLGKGFSEESERFSKTKGFARKFTGDRKKALWGGGLIGGSLIGILMFIFFTLPLKVMHIVNNLERQFYASALQATGDMNDNFFRHYVVKQLVPGMVANNCTSTRVNRDCVNTSTSSTIVGVLYNGWRDGRLETRMAESGIEIKKQGNAFYIKTPSTTGDMGELLGNYSADNPDAFKQDAFRKLDRNDIRKEMRAALKQDTKWDRVMFRFKVGGMLERKYGIKRCVIACETRDKWSDNYGTKKVAFKAYFLERVIEPRNEMLSLIFSCGLDSFKCADVGDTDPDTGEQLSDFEKDLRERLADYRDKYGERSLDDLRAEADNVSRVGAFEYMFSKLVGETVAKLTSKAIPVVGWIDLGATLVSAGDNLAPALTKLTYITNATTAVATYSMYRTNADEIKPGNVDAAMLGSVAESLSPTDGTDRKDQGGAGAEGSPLYGSLMGASTSVSLNPFGSKAYAAGTGYTCEDNDNKPPPNGEPVCRVERLDNKTSVGTVADFIDQQFKNNPQLVGGVVLAKVWDYTGGAVLDFADKLLAPVINGFIALIPGDPIAQLQKFAEPIIANLMKFIVKPTITNSTSGARMYNLAAAGADESGNSFAHYGLGGARISDAEAFAIRESREAEYKQEFNNRSMFARMFSTDTQYSLVSKMALATPGNSTSGTTYSMLSTITNPFNSALSGLGSMFAGSSVSAAPTLTADPFGIPQFGYPANDPVFTQDPEKYIEENNCEDENTIKEWGDRAVTNGATGTQDHNAGDTEGCLLITSAAGSAGALFTDDVLTAEELGENTTLPEEPTDSADSFTVASYNILQGIHHYPKKCLGGESALECIRRRSDLQAKIITASETQTQLAGQQAHLPFDIVGMQEVSPLQYTNLKNNLGPEGYAAFPENGDRIDNQEDGGHAIFWNTAKFSLIESGKAPGLSNVANTPNRGNITVPWVGLQTLSGKKVYVMSVHWPVAGYTDPGLGDVATLRKGVDLARAWVQSKAGPDATVILVGDFNDAPEQRTTYCGLTQGGLLQNAFDLRKKANAETPCPSIGELRGIDHIYATPTENLTVTKWARLQDAGIVAQASDHVPTYATYSFPIESTGELQWPVALEDYVPLSSCWEKPGHTGIDIPINTKPILAADSGKVVKTGGPSGDAGNYIIINHGGGRWTNYQHLSVVNVATGQEVTQGDVIGTSGNTGYVRGSNGGYHLHFGVTNKEGLDSRSLVAYSLNPLTFLPKDRDLGVCN